MWNKDSGRHSGVRRKTVEQSRRSENDSRLWGQESVPREGGGWAEGQGFVPDSVPHYMNEAPADPGDSPELDMILEIDKRRERKRRRKKRRRVLFVGLCLIFLVLAVGLVVRTLSGLVGGRSEGGATFEEQDYYICDDEREDFQVLIDGSKIPGHGNGQRYIAIHFLGVEGENCELEDDGVGTHFYIYYDGTIHQAADLDAVTWQVGTGGGYQQVHPWARNSNTIGIELCVKCDGDPDDYRSGQWYFTEETQRAAVKLVRWLMREMDIPLDNVLRHGDIVDKWCPAPYLDNNRYNGSWTWDEFKQAVVDLPEEEVPDYPVVRKP